MTDGHVFDRYESLEQATFDHTSNLFRRLPVGFDGANYNSLYISVDGALSTASPTSIVATGVLVLTASAADSIAAATGQTKILLAHATSGKGPVRVSFQTDQGAFGVEIKDGARPTFDIGDETTYITNTDAGNTVRVYYIQYGGPE